MTTFRNTFVTTSAGLITAMFSSAAMAAPSDDAQAEGKVSLVSGADGTSAVGDEKPETSTRWIRRYRPRAHDLTFGIYAGAFFPASNVELRRSGSESPDFDGAAADVGVRLGYYPIRHFGLEGEFSAIPTRAGGDQAFIYSARAQGVLQPGFWRITPFAVLGGGVIGVVSSDSVVGNDTDAALHVGGGIKIHATDRIILRLEGRNVMSPRLGTSNRPANSPEALFTVAFRFGVGPKPAPPEPPPPDRDGDGVPDETDHCPYDAGSDQYEGCPIPDSDCDGLDDAADRCPNEAGVEADGCPVPDQDGDGILDSQDQCPAEAGPQPDGCPLKDSDGDGILDRKDKCPNEPETPNGFDDLDGCPDDIPAEVEKFTGVIQGIYFDTGKATVKPTSETTLDAAAKVLAKYDNLKVEIVGHTDDRGKRKTNVELSTKRAESVKAYLVGKGVPADRVKTRGAGPDEPIEDNKTRAGRAKNRRIEFKLIHDDAGGAK